MLSKSLLVSSQVFKNLQLFLENKQPEDDLFDRLNVRNTHVNICLQGLSLNEMLKLIIVIICVFSVFPLVFHTLFLCLLQTSILNKHLQELMDGLTAKVFRTYNASITLQQQLKELTCRE